MSNASNSSWQMLGPWPSCDGRCDLGDLEILEEGRRQGQRLDPADQLAPDLRRDVQCAAGYGDQLQKLGIDEYYIQLLDQEVVFLVV